MESARAEVPRPARAPRARRPAPAAASAPYFEGGQLPLVRKLPYRRGFRNVNRVEYQAVNLADLAAFAAGATVDVAALVGAGLLKNDREKVKVLGTGELDRALTVTAHKFSASARQKIEAAGGACHALDDASGAA